MALIRRTIEELRANPYRMTEEERRRILSMTEAEIEAAALADPDNPPWTDEELAEARRERDKRLAASRSTREAAAASHAREMEFSGRRTDEEVAEAKRERDERLAKGKRRA